MGVSDEEIEDLDFEQDPDESQEEPQTKPRVIPKTRKHLTGVELEARFDAWTSHQRDRLQARSADDNARVIRRLLIIVMLALVVATMVFSTISGDDFSHQRADNAEKILSLTSQKNEARVDPQDVTSPEQIASLTESASDTAGDVAAEQQRFAALYRKASTSKDPQNGAPNKAMLAIAAHRKDLADYFDPRSYQADEDEQYRWSTAYSFDGATEIDPRFAWYVRYDGDEAASAKAYKWSVETVTPLVDSKAGVPTVTTARVVWMCRDSKTDDVLAWASADYTESADDKGAFDDLSVSVTKTGAKYAQPDADKDGE